MHSEPPTLGRDEQRERRGKAAELDRALKRAAVGSGWNCARGILFRDHKGWFVHVQSAVWITTRRTKAELHVKPMAIDPIFWEIVQLTENNRQPLSFRANGAWTCSTPIFCESDVDENPFDSARLSTNIIGWATEQLSTIEPLNDDLYLNFVGGAPRGFPGAYLATEVASLIHFHRIGMARAVCEAASARGDNGGFTMTGINGEPTNFVRMAMDFLDRGGAQPTHDGAS